MKTPIIAGFGEVMLRLSPDGKKRFAQVLPGELEATYGGGEANFCASIALLGGKSRYLTALPDNPIAKGFSAFMAACGVDPAHIRTIVPLPKNYPEMEQVIREEIEYHGVSVVISRRECIQTLKRHAKK